MARFKIEIPDSKLDLILELFNSFSFLKYEAIDPEPNGSEDDSIKDALQHPDQQRTSDKLAYLAELRSTINNIQTSRETLNAESKSILFRYPHGTEVGAIKVNNLNHLILTIEQYYRVQIEDIMFKAAASDDGYEMDKYQVYIALSDNSEIIAGYCNKKLK